MIWLFLGKTEKTDFSSNDFKLLWKKEKDIKVNSLKNDICRKLELKENVITAVPDAVEYYDIKSE